MLNNRITSIVGWTAISQMVAIMIGSQTGVPLLLLWVFGGIGCVLSSVYFGRAVAHIDCEDPFQEEELCEFELSRLACHEPSDDSAPAPDTLRSGPPK
jgi:hypothetical protein